MGKVLDPKPLQWQLKKPSEDVPEDRILLLVNKIMEVLNLEVDSTIVQLTAIRLVLKGVVGNYRNVMGHKNAEELMRQAAEMSEQYEVKGIDDNPKG